MNSHLKDLSSILIVVLFGMTACWGDTQEPAKPTEHQPAGRDQQETSGAPSTMPPAEPPAEDESEPVPQAMPVSLGPEPRMEFVLPEGASDSWGEENLNEFKDVVRDAAWNAGIGIPVDERLVQVHHEGSSLASIGASGRLVSWYQHELKILVKAGDDVLYEKVYEGMVADAYKATTYSDGRTSGIRNAPVNYKAVVDDIAMRLEQDPLQSPPWPAPAPQ